MTTCLRMWGVNVALPVTFLLQKREAKKDNSPSVMEIHHFTVSLHPGFPISFFKNRKDVPDNPKMC